MTFEEYAALPEEEQRAVFQSIYDGPENPLFVAIKRRFLEAYPVCKDGAYVYCGLGSGMGPYNAITVESKPGFRFRLPKSFMGAMIVRARPRKVRLISANR